MRGEDALVTEKRSVFHHLINGDSMTARRDGMGIVYRPEEQTLTPGVWRTLMFEDKGPWGCVKRCVDFLMSEGLSKRQALMEVCSWLRENYSVPDDLPLLMADALEKEADALMEIV